MKHFTVPIVDYHRWLKKSHKCSDLPGYYIDTEGEYDIGVTRDRVTIYPREGYGRSKPRAKR
jgi:hypothetical protein